MQGLRDALSSSPRQTFVAFPLLVVAVDVLRGSRPRLRKPAMLWLLVMAAGYALYRGAGTHRSRTAGGRGFDSTPTELVTDGPYAVTRNPMYIGHLLFMVGLVGATRSPIAMLLFLRQLARFRDRVALDEDKLERLFGEDFRAYRARAPRWF